MTFAVVPACGHSTRMGRAKLSLPLGHHTVIQRVVATLREGGVECIVIVVGPHVPELIPLATAAGAEVLALAEPTPDMRATVEAGLNWIEDRHHPRPEDAWLLSPADHPGFTAEVVRQLLTAAAHEPARSVFVPIYEGRRGHPGLLRWRHTTAIRSLPPGEGINTLLRQLAAETCELPVSSSSILVNLDTPEDYEQFRGNKR